MDEAMGGVARHGRWWEELPSTGMIPVDEALAGCWLLDLGQGDLAVAQARAQQALDDHDRPGALAGGIVSLMRGRANEARAALGRAALGASDPFLANAALFQLETWCNVTTPDGCSWAFPETDVAWTAAMKRWYGWQTANRGAPRDRRSRLGEVLLSRVTASIARSRATAPFLRLRGQKALIGQETLESLDDALGLAAGLDNPALVRILAGARQVVAAEMLRAAGLADEARAVLAAARPSLLATDEPCMVGWAALVEGDALATGARGTSPVGFGHAIQPSATQTSTLDDRALLQVSVADAVGARTCYREALAIYQSAGARRGMGQALIRLAYLAGAEGRWDEAGSIYGKARLHMDQAGDDLGAFCARAGQLRVDVETGKGEAPISHEADGLATMAANWGAVSWGLGWGLAFARVGRAAHLVDHDLERALGGAAAARPFFAQLDAPSMEAQVHGDRAAVLKDADQVAEAIISIWEQLACYERALLRATDQKPSIAAVRNASLMSLYLLVSSDEDEQGLEALEKRLVSLVGDGPGSQQPEALLALLTALAAGQSPDHDSVMAMAAQQSLPSLKEVRYRLLYTRGLRKRDREEADADAVLEEAFAAAADLPGRDQEQCLIRAAQGRYAEAREHLRRHLAAPPSPPTADSNPQVAQIAGDVWRHWHIRSAMLCSRLESWPETRAALEAMGPVDDLRRRLCEDPAAADLDLLATIGRLLVGEGRIEEGLLCYETAVGVLENRRRLLAREAWRRRFTVRPLVARTYREWLDALARAKQWERAFSAADLLSARSIVENQGAEKDERAFRRNPLFLRYREKAAEMERLAVALRAAEGQDTDRSAIEARLLEYRMALRDIATLEAELAASSRQWRDLALPPAAAVTPGQVSQALPPRTLLLAFVPAERSMIAFALAPDRPLQGWTVAFGDRLGQSRVQSLRRLERFSATAASAFSSIDDGEDIASMFLEPCAEALDAAEQLLIVPMTELSTVPFHVIRWRGTPLGLQKVISYLPTAGLLRERSDVRASEATALVVGDPLPPPTLTSLDERASSLLPGSRPEAQLVARLYSTAPLLRDAGSEEVIRTRFRDHPRIIHFACHGRLSRENANASGFVLPDGRVFTISDLAGMNLEAHLVVMSACETAAGVRQGSELVGVAQALLQAGVRSVVATQWPAADLCTLIAMVEFHVGVRRGQPAGRALRDALVTVAGMTAGSALAWLASKVTEPATRDFLMADVYSMAGGHSQARSLYDRAWHAFSQEGDGDRARLCELASEDIPGEPDAFTEERRLFEHPFFWAPFVALGEWRSILRPDVNTPAGNDS